MLKRALFVVVAIGFLAGCASHSSALPPIGGGVGVVPFMNQTGNQNGWLTFTIQYQLQASATGVGHDGAFWTSNLGFNNNLFVRTDLAGNQIGYSATSGLQGGAVAPNPDGNIYAQETDGQFHAVSIAQVTPQGVITYFPVTISGQWYFGPMVSASDGRLWMILNSVSDGSKIIAAMTTAGVFSVVNANPTTCQESGLVRGADKNLWSNCGGQFERISVGDGSTTLFPTSVPLGAVVVAGTDGNVWSEYRLDRTNSGLVRSDMSGNVTTYPLKLTVNSFVTGFFVSASHHRLVVTTDKFVIFDELSGRVTRSVPFPNDGSGFGCSGLLIGPDTQMWCAAAPVLYGYILDAIVATPSSLTVSAGSSTPLAVTEKTSSQHVFSAVSNNPKVATVSGSGKSFTVTGVSTGSTTITVSDKIGNSLDVPVTVQ